MCKAMFSRQNANGDNHSSTRVPGLRRWRRRLGVTAAAGMLTTAVAMAPAIAAATPARLADSMVPGYGWSSGGWSDPYGPGSDWGTGSGNSGSGNSGSGSGTGTADSQSATAQESRGVVLIDT